MIHYIPSHTNVEAADKEFMSNLSDDGMLSAEGAKDGTVLNWLG
jgi:hypothetical protein